MLRHTTPPHVDADAADVVVGCGSNVVDLFMRLRAIPKLGEKGYFASPTNIVEVNLRPSHRMA